MASQPRADAQRGAEPAPVRRVGSSRPRKRRARSRASCGVARSWLVPTREGSTPASRAGDGRRQSGQCMCRLHHGASELGAALGRLVHRARGSARRRARSSRPDGAALPSRTPSNVPSVASRDRHPLDREVRARASECPRARRGRRHRQSDGSCQPLAEHAVRAQAAFRDRSRPASGVRDECGLTSPGGWDPTGIARRCSPVYAGGFSRSGQATGATSPTIHLRSLRSSPSSPSHTSGGSPPVPRTKRRWRSR